MTKIPVRALMPIPFALLLGFWTRDRGVAVDPRTAHRSDALSRVLEARGMKVVGVTWLPEERRLPLLSRRARAVVKASEQDEPAVLYLLTTRLSPEGVLLDVGEPKRLTRSSHVEESSPAIQGETVATALVADGLVLGVQLVDLAGEPRPEGPTWTRIARIQNALTNLQETGQLAGLGRRGFRLVPPVAGLTMRFEPGVLVVQGEGHEARIPLRLAPGATEEEGEWLKPEPHEKGQVGNLITWAVDRMRNMPWFGDRNMQLLKTVAFRLSDAASLAKSKVVSDRTDQEIQQDLGAIAQSSTPAAFTDPETGWPPPKLEVLLKNGRQIPGEGEWILLDKDPYIRLQPGAPPAFATTFLRTDRERPYTRVYITLWDPRQVTLHPVAGSVEPVNAMGNAGTGVIPRAPETLRRVVAAFNGGFQALHGEFGVMAEGSLYLPPKPYAATVAELRDGSTGFGVWPDSIDIPPNVVGFRQNLTPLVMDEKPNPYERTWWGGTPPGWEDREHTTRSGLCLTREGFVAYFYGNDISSQVLGLAMIQARCQLGMHLDMNPGHTGLEFYHVAPKEEWKPLGRPLQRDWEAEGEVGSTGWRFRARRMVRGMGLMNFPRYIQREARDFFYLSLRPVLPGADLTPVVSPPEGGEGKWRVKGLAQHGFPYALAITTFRPDPARPGLRLRLLKIDPATVVPAGVGSEGETVVTLQAVGAPKAGEPTLWWRPGSFVVSKQPVAGGTALLEGGSSGEAALGIDGDGMLLYVEVEAGSADADTLDRFLKNLGCSQRMGLPRSLAPLQGGTTMLSGAPGKRVGRREVRLLRGKAPGGQRIFPDTPVVPRSVWEPIQRKRIRYFKHAQN
ncbi:MAG: hypothetical protein RMJ98_02540 [Myxococcales bacterium]|nr:hypothetical protein [Polyangiaceae bacterium]MDW8248167.1 hypothetical protein [Myxococcales bacterium]